VSAAQPDGEERDRPVENVGELAERDQQTSAMATPTWTRNIG
jgi:hypothetical protein